MLSTPLLDAQSLAGAHDEVRWLAGACLDLPFATWTAEVLRLQAEAFLATGASADAEVTFRAAFDTAQCQGAVAYELRAARRLLEGRGRGVRVRSFRWGKVPHAR